MANRTKVTGLQNVMKNLNREIAKLGKTTMAGLIKGGILIIRDTEKTAPLTPVDLGNLRASRYMVTGLGSNKEPSPQFKGDDVGKLKSDHSSVVGKSLAKTAGKSLVVLGFSANYAAAVEENKDPKKWNRPGSGRAFLQSSINRNKAKILAVIATSAKIK